MIRRSSNKGCRGVTKFWAREVTSEMAHDHTRQETKSTKVKSTIEVISIKEVESRQRGATVEGITDLDLV